MREPTPDTSRAAEMALCGLLEKKEITLDDVRRAGKRGYEYRDVKRRLLLLRDLHQVLCEVDLPHAQKEADDFDARLRQHRKVRPR